MRTEDTTPIDRPHVHSGGKKVTLDLEKTAAPYVETEYRIHGGDVQIIGRDEADHDLPDIIGTFEQLGIPNLSGTVAWEFSIEMSEWQLANDVFFQATRVCYNAQLKVNGHPLQPSIWPPHIWKINEYLHPGPNNLTLLVSNTLANQLCDEDNIEQAKTHGWFNTYYSATVDFMKETLRSGLAGDVEMYMMTE